MKTNLKILGVEKKTSKNNQEYYSFQTTAGTMSCFDLTTAKELIEHVDENIEVEIAKKNGFTNLVKFLGNVAKEQVISEDVPPADKFADARKSKDTSIYTSYAKDVFIKILESQEKFEAGNDSSFPQVRDMMDMAVKVIKQAKEAFK